LFSAPNSVASSSTILHFCSIFCAVWLYHVVCFVLQKSHIPGMPHSGGGGMLGKVGTALGLGTGAAALGGAVLGVE
jgi:hypothetical protein